MKELSIVVPFYNEGRTICANIRAIGAAARRLGLDYELIAVDDGSSDGGWRSLQREAIPRLWVERDRLHQGKGFATRKGILRSSGAVVCFMDADLAVAPDHLGLFVEAVRKGADVAVASRGAPGTAYLYPVSFKRRVTTRVFTLLRTLIVGMPRIRDTQCGFKVFRGEPARSIFRESRIDGFAFDTEVLYLAHRGRLTVRELPVTLNNPPETRVRLVRDSLSMAVDLLRIRLNSVLGRYS